MRNRVVSCLVLIGASAFGAENVPPEKSIERAKPVSFESAIAEGRAALAGGDADGARRVYQSVCSSPSPISHAALCEHELGAVDQTAGRLAPAEAHYLRARSAWELAGSAFTVPHAFTLTNLAQTYIAEHRTKEAEGVLTEALNLAEKVRLENPRLYATVLSHHGVVRGEADPDGARCELSEAIRILEPMPAAAKDVAFASDALGMVELRAGNYATGESLFRRALAMIVESPARTNIQIAAYETNLGLALDLTERYPEALSVLQRANAVFEAQTKPDALHFAAELTELSAAEKALGKFSLAEEHALRAAALLAKEFPADSREALLTQVNLAMVYLDERKTADAEKILPNLVTSLRNAAPGTRALGDSLRALARLRAVQRRWNDAASLYREAISIYESTFNPDHPELGRARSEYATVTKHRVPAGSLPA